MAARQGAGGRGRLLESAKIVVGCVILSVLLGWAVDVVTANVAVEYFTVHHPKVVDSQSPWVMALIWGFIATWWAGLIAGALLGIVNLLLKNPLSAERVLRMVAVSCLILWVLMMLAVAGVYLFAGTVPLDVRPATFESDRRLMAVAVGHLLEYALAGAAAIVVAILMVRTSRKEAASPADGDSPLQAPG